MKTKNMLREHNRDFAYRITTEKRLKKIQNSYLQAIEEDPFLKIIIIVGFFAFIGSIITYLI